jgi:hypothetical protein
MNTSKKHLLRSILTGLYFDGYGANESSILNAKRFDLVGALFVKAQYDGLEVVEA